MQQAVRAFASSCVSDSTHWMHSGSKDHCPLMHARLTGHPQYAIEQRWSELLQLGVLAHFSL